MEGARRSVETQAAATPLPAYVVEFRSVFAKEDLDILPEHHKWDHAIELTPGAQVVKGLPPVSIGTGRVECLPGREPLYRTNPTLEILYRSPHVLY